MGTAASATHHRWIPTTAGSLGRIVSRGTDHASRALPGAAYYTTNIEDGIALADAELRAAFVQHYPEAWSRIQARRAFMQDVRGMQLKPEVLPFSNIPAYLPPFWLAPHQAMRLVK